MPPDGPVLGFDTSAAHCAAAVVSGSEVLAWCVEPMETGQAERLMPLLDDVLTEAGVRFRDLVALGVGTGPGNFTGVRIAVSAARGLALALGVPAIGVTGFEALAFGQAGPVVTLLDARRGAFWLATDGVPPGPCTVETLPDGLEGRDVVGYRAAEVAALTGGRVRLPVAPLPVAIAQIAGTRRAVPQPRPAPMYLRPADAALPSEPPVVILP